MPGAVARLAQALLSGPLRPAGCAAGRIRAALLCCGRHDSRYPTQRGGLDRVYSTEFLGVDMYAFLYSLALVPPAPPWWVQLRSLNVFTVLKTRKVPRNSVLTHIDLLVCSTFHPLSHCLFRLRAASQ